MIFITESKQLQELTFIEGSPSASTLDRNLTQMISFNLYSSPGVGTVTNQFTGEGTEIQKVKNLNHIHFASNVCALNHHVVKKLHSHGGQNQFHRRTERFQVTMNKDFLEIKELYLWNGFPRALMDEGKIAVALSMGLARQ